MEGTFVNKSVLEVKSLFHDYSADFVDDLNKEMVRVFNHKKVHCIADSNVFNLHKNRMQYISNAATFIEIKAEEQNKTIETAHHIMLTLLNNGISKNDFIVVVGGGLTQDIGAFVANTLKRGIRWYFIPTTLLAMCDSCIGSKYGINMAGYKNQIGGFWPASKVLIDIEFLNTLNREDIVSGIGEIFKVHLISGVDDFKNIEENHRLMMKDGSVLKSFILRSLEIKKKIVEEDELDKDYRHILNYGHTFGHGIESYSNNIIPHGIGVTIGMEIANYISLKKGYLAEDIFYKVSSILRQYIPYASLDFSDHEKMTATLMRDKKYDGKTLNAILSKGIGRVFKDKINIDDQLLGFIESYTHYFNKNAMASEEL
jgi:3-dehydroquinate synthase